MGAKRRVAVSLVLAVLAVVAVLSGCRTGDVARPAATASGPAVVVASFDFPESELLAEIYAGALEGAGIPVRRQLGLGPREVVQPAILQGLVDVVPEYLGSALASLDPATRVDTSDPVAVRAALTGALARWNVVALASAPAQNQNAVVVTQKTADRLGVRTLSDLARVRSPLSLAATAECSTRPYCAPGLERVYGLEFARTVEYRAAAQRATAVREGVADAAVLFTTDAELADRDLVVLQDDRRLQPVENVVPIVSGRAMRRYGSRLAGVLDRVSAQLSTANVRFLNWRVDVGGKSASAEARGWLERHGIAVAESDHRAALP